MSKFVGKTFIVDSSAAFLRNVDFDSSVNLKGVTTLNLATASTDDTPYAIVAENTGQSQLVYRQLGDMAWESSSNFASRSYVDSSLNERDNSINENTSAIADHESSLGNLTAWNEVQDASIEALQNAEVFGWNGLTKTDNSIGLGGNVVAATTIDVSDYSFSIAGVPEADIQSTLGLNTDGHIDLLSENTVNNDSAQVQVTNEAISISYFGDDGEKTLNIDKNETGVLLTDNETSTGFVYEADYSGTQTAGARWIPDKGYVDLAVAGATIGAKNGVDILADGSIGLGGTLVQDTSINANQNIFGIVDAETISLDGSLVVLQQGDFIGGGSFVFVGDAGTGSGAQLLSTAGITSTTGGVVTAPGVVKLNAYGDSGNPGNNYLEASTGTGIKMGYELSSPDFAGYKVSNEGKITIQDDVSSAGVGYEADYSVVGIAEYGDRWIPDKGYVDSAVSGVNAWNGLTETDNSIGLGGDLIQSTTINTNANPFAIVGDLTITGDASFGSFRMDGVAISVIDTSTEGIGVGSDSAIPTSAAVKKYVDNEVIGAAPNWEQVLINTAPDMQFADIPKVADSSYWGIIHGDTFGTGSWGRLNTTASTMAMITSYLNSDRQAGLTVDSLEYIRLQKIRTTTSESRLGEIRVEDSSVILRAKARGTDYVSVVIDGSRGVEIIDDVDGNGMFYNADYSATQEAGDRWIPDKGYVDLAVGGATIGAKNGVDILADGSVGLGGSLTEPTTIDVAGQSLAIDGGLTITGDASFGSFSMDSVNITEVVTSGEGMGSGSDTAIPTTLLVKNYVDNNLTDISTFVTLHEASLGNIDASVNTLFSNLGSTGLNEVMQVNSDASIATAQTYRIRQGGDGVSNYVGISALSGAYSVKTNDAGDTNPITFDLNSTAALAFARLQLTQDDDASTGIEVREGTGEDFARLYHDSGNATSAIKVTDASMLVIDTLNSKGLYYDDDYSSGATARWITDKDYVDTAVAQASPNVTNGLNLAADSSVQLGGELTHDTSLYGNHALTFGGFAASDQLSTLSAYTSSSVTMTAGNLTAPKYSGLSLEDNKAQLATVAGVQNKAIDVDSDIGITILDTSALGAVYAGDYETNFVDRSLITKQYLDDRMDTSLGLFVKKAGDTMTGSLIVSDGGVAIQGGGLDVTNDVSIGGSLLVSGGATFKGDVYVDGSMFFTDVETIDVSSAYIQLNTGLTGTPPANLQSGIIVGRGSSDPYAFVYDETTQTFRVGITTFTGSQYDDASTQAVATREDSPQAQGVGFWNGVESRIDTTANFTFSASEGLGVDASAQFGGTLTLNGVQADGAETTALLINASNEVVSRELTSAAFTTPANLTVQGPLSVGGGTGATLAAVDISILQATSTQDGYLSSTDWTDFDQKIDDVSTVNGVVGGHEVYSGEEAGTAYIKKIVAGTGATITSDASIVTISVTGAAGYVSKYVGNIDGTAGTSATISAATHTLGNGPFHVSVFDAFEQVYPDISYAANGNVTIDWAPGSLTTDVSVFITG